MNSKLKIAQSIMLDTLIEVDRVCKKHNLQYWLDSGTLLGAVRHKGFIPWDDDLDIVMTIEDYKKFCTIAQKELKDGMFFQTFKTDKSFPHDVAKIRNKRGKIIEKYEVGKKVEYNQGIFIDIFPMIAIRNTILHTATHKIMLLLIKLFSYKYLNIKSIRHRLVKLVNMLHSGWDNSKNVVVYGGNLPYINFGVEVNSLFPLEKIEFCNYEFFAPKNRDEYLSSLYGKNYMQIPPKNRQITHASSIEIYDEK